MSCDFDGTLAGFSFGFGMKGIPATLGRVAHQTLLLDVRGLDLLVGIESRSRSASP